MIGNRRFAHSLAQVARDVTRMREFAHLSAFVVESILSNSENYNSFDPCTNKQKAVEFFESNGELVVRFDIENTIALLVGKKGISCANCRAIVDEYEVWRRKHDRYNNIFRSKEWRRLLGKHHHRFMLTPSLCATCHASFMNFVRRHKVPVPDRAPYSEKIVELYAAPANEWLSHIVSRAA